MNEATIQRLLSLNQSFYDSMAESFTESRLNPPPSFDQLLAKMPRPCPRLLDVGCGNGRFGHFLQTHQAVQQYTGVDFSQELLARARSVVDGEFYSRDLSRPDSLDGLGTFDVIVCLAAMHHLPGRHNRLRLLRDMKAHLAADGRLILANWQFMDSERQRRKIRPWAEIGLSNQDVEPNDYLLTWQRQGFAYRYVCKIDATETAALATDAGLQIIDQFRSDGREGNLSLFTVLIRAVPGTGQSGLARPGPEAQCQALPCVSS
jgi:tRNA (uracil-5-)-methyltransferase TRM9